MTTTNAKSAPATLAAILQAAETTGTLNRKAMANSMNSSVSTARRRLLSGDGLSLNEFIALVNALPEPVGDDLLAWFASRVHRGILFIEPVEVEALDVNRDGKVDVRDAVIQMASTIGRAQQDGTSELLDDAADNLLDPHETAAQISVANELGRGARIFAAIVSRIGLRPCR